MDLNEAKKLKEEGDNAKVEGNLQDALNRYADAYHLAKVVFDTTLADILASTAEIKLEQKELVHIVKTILKVLLILAFNLLLKPQTTP